MYSFHSIHFELPGLYDNKIVKMVSENGNLNNHGNIFKCLSLNPPPFRIVNLWNRSNVLFLPVSWKIENFYIKYIGQISDKPIIVCSIRILSGMFPILPC